MPAPQHSITAVITFLPTLAFDMERVKAERKAMPNDGDGHPVVLYFSGETRYDLDASAHVGDEVRSARDYLRPDHGCREWKLRRLKLLEVARCRDAGGRVGQLHAFAISPIDGRSYDDAQIEALTDEYGSSLLYQVGEAALLASESPKASEKKL